MTTKDEALKQAQKDEPLHKLRRVQSRTGLMGAAHEQR